MVLVVLIIMNNFNDKPHASYNNTKTQMLNEIKKSPKFKRVFNNGEFETQNVTIKITVIHNHIYY